MPGKSWDFYDSLVDEPDEDAPRASDERYRASYRREAAERDRAEAERYRAEMVDERLDPDTGERAGPTVHQQIQVRLEQASHSSLGGTLAGGLLGGFAYFLGLAFLRGGPAGAKAWLSAKFLNKVTTTKPPGGQPT